MPATVTTVIAQARNNLLDTTAVSGQLLTDNQYLGLVNEAILELSQVMRDSQQFRIVRDRAARVLKNTGYLDLDDNFPGFGYATDCWMQAMDGFIQLTGGSGTGALLVSWSTPQTLSVGQPVVVGGFSDPRIGGEFPIYQVNSTTSITLVLQTANAITIPPGWLMWGSAGWGFPIYQIRTIPSYPNTPGSGDGRIAFEDGGVKFAPTGSDRMLRMRYVLGGNPSVALTDILDIQEGMVVLGQMLALKAGNALGGNPSRLDELKQTIYGDGTRRRPGSLALLRRAAALQRQNQQIVRPRWRARHAPTYPTVVQSS